MKATVIGFVILGLIVVAGYIGFSKLQKNTAEGTVYKTEAVKKSGTLQAANPPGDDYTHILLTGTGTVKVNSYSVVLKQYEGKKVEITGQYSGNTLFADSAAILP